MSFLKIAPLDRGRPTFGHIESESQWFFRQDVLWEVSPRTPHGSTAVPVCRRSFMSGASKEMYDIDQMLH